MVILRKLNSSIDIEDIIEIYNKGNKIAIKNTYDICIGFKDKVHIDEINTVDLSEEKVDIIKGINILGNYQINLKKDSTLAIESFHLNSEGEYIAYVKPFNGRHKDKMLPMYLYVEGVIADTVYEIKE